MARKKINLNQNAAPASSSPPEIKPQIIQSFAEFFQYRAKRINAIYGGRGSGKSHSMHVWLAAKLYTSPTPERILVMCKTFPQLRMTAYKGILDVLNSWGTPYEHDKSNHVIRYGLHEIFFVSLDDPEKIKSANWTDVWLEEATNFDFADYLQLKMRFTGKLYMTFNPIDNNHWIWKRVVEEGGEDVATHHSTYRDNRFVSDDIVKEIESLIAVDSNFYQVYSLGLPGVLKHLIYSNYDIIDTRQVNGEAVYGLDFGFNAPSALVEVRWYDGECFVHELLYQPGLTNSDLMAKCRELIPNLRSYLYADSAEPARIEEFMRNGFNVYPADKDVKAGIDRVKGIRLHITKDSVNLLREIKSYKYKEDKMGNVIDEPVKYDDHVLDSCRYAIMSSTNRPTNPFKIPIISFKRKG